MRAPCVAASIQRVPPRLCTPVRPGRERRAAVASRRRRRHIEGAQVQGSTVLTLNPTPSPPGVRAPGGGFVWERDGAETPPRLDSLHFPGHPYQGRRLDGRKRKFKFHLCSPPSRWEIAAPVRANAAPAHAKGACTVRKWQWPRQPCCPRCPRLSPPCRQGQAPGGGISPHTVRAYRTLAMIVVCGEQSRATPRAFPSFGVRFVSWVWHGVLRHSAAARRNRPPGGASTHHASRAVLGKLAFAKLAMGNAHPTLKNPQFSQRKNLPPPRGPRRSFQGFHPPPVACGQSATTL